MTNETNPSVPAPDPDDREALAQATADAWNSVSTLECTSGSIGPRAVADKILAAGFRRLTVTPEMIEAGAKAIAARHPYAIDADESFMDVYRDDARAVLEAALGDTK